MPFLRAPAATTIWMSHQEKNQISLNTKRPRRDTSLSLQDSLVYRPVLTVAVRPTILERQQCLHDERK